VVDGPGFERDPAFLATPLLRYPYRKDPHPLRMTWRGGTAVMGDGPLRMRFAGLDPQGHYRLRIVYHCFTGQTPSQPRLTAGADVEIHPARVLADGPRPLEFDIPHAATQHGSLALAWHHDLEVGATPVSELWLIKQMD